ncbi:hypothetical protein DV20_01270 [Amycolatopsis rifamycinica]|uniref:Dienelactone hydrolase domain-containing protein n=1 Tax=Amycolatopsis rifamycinica TaxID=287986 RepID=A0A066UIQ3_9PSEU|nr:hypothetical protein DV20_01270 [Amycolatopsis rifamycinica]
MGDHHRDAAVVVAHEILGLTPHITRMKTALEQFGVDVYTPQLTQGPARVFAPSDQEAAYAHFTRAGGVVAMAARLNAFGTSLRSRYRKVGAMGFSVGATSGWIVASEGVFDAVVCFYGSRIRDYPELAPTCPCLLLFAEREPGFDPLDLAERLEEQESVTTRLYPCGHGFADMDNPNHDTVAADDALATAKGFLRAVLLEGKVDDDVEP